MPATLADIRTKVRRLTRSPSTTQLTDAEIDSYVNDFLLYDFPEHLRLFTFRKTLSFYTDPYIAEYSTNTDNADDPLYNFKNAYITTHDPVYISGYKMYFTQSRNDFFSLYPTIQGQTQIATGDGVTTLFTGTLTGVPVLPNQVAFTSIDANNMSLVLSDVPQVDGVTGHTTVLGDLYTPNETISRGTINYVTGVYSFTFPAAPETSMAVYAQTVPYSAGRPMSILYFDNTFTVRPVPDKSYQITIETYVRPTSLVAAGDYPMLEQHWKYIAYGASKTIFEDRMDMESVQLIMPEFKQQEMLVQRRTLIQQSNERTATIYAQSLSDSNIWNYNR